MSSSSPAPPTAPGASLSWLPGLMLAVFVIGTDDFIIAGVLPEIAADLRVSEAAAGQLVTVFSLVYAVAAPVMAVLTARLPRRAIVVGGLAVFALVNATTVAATSYPALLALRVLAALVAASVSPAVFAVAGTLAPSHRTGRAIGAVAAGLTVSLVVGVPLGSWLGAEFGWRATFVLVAGLTVVAVAVTAGTLPRLPDQPATGVRERLSLLRRPAVLTCVAGTVVGACAGLLPYVFIAPVIVDLTGAERSWVPVVIGVYGLAGAIGTVLGGRLNDQWGTDRSVLALLTLVCGATVAMAVTGLLGGGDVPLPLLVALIVVWGLAGWAYNPPMNARALRLAGAAGTEAIALNTSGLYVGIAAAGVVGGGALSVGGGVGVLLAAGLVGFGNLAFMIRAVRRYPAAPAASAGAS
ncbi:MFS transporter [Streptomyces sp. DSM 44915]|uniref:MFS transporter n=1 Tax=Streptomyces chisholmiae TaxID=3075540 RepID=A0ABU2JJQ9_9ACTN|nr:MFS transporter [Streptomyces sp. DSM 44915]MDT0264739.1 MFS transporter [Streptomyces sp. DSM 44915]